MLRLCRDISMHVKKAVLDRLVFVLSSDHAANRMEFVQSGALQVALELGKFVL
jgi:hypothetical protein